MLRLDKKRLIQVFPQVVRVSYRPRQVCQGAAEGRQAHAARLSFIRECLPTSTTLVLVKKLISVLEPIEKLSVYTYDTNLQIRTKRLRFRLE